MRDILQWHPAQILGRVSYCAFLVHVSLQRIRIGGARYPVYISEYQYVSYLMLQLLFFNYIRGYPNLIQNWIILKK